jgi:hypothetical protein
VVPQGLDVSFPFVLFVIFGALFLVIFLERFRGLSLWGFLGSRVRGALGGISSIPLVLASFGGPNLGYGVPMRCSYYLPILVQNRVAIREIGS